MNFGHGSAKSAEVLVSILSSAHDTQVLVFFCMLQTTSASSPIKGHLIRTRVSRSANVKPITSSSKVVVCHTSVKSHHHYVKAMSYLPTGNLLVLTYVHGYRWLYDVVHGFKQSV